MSESEFIGESRFMREIKSLHRPNNFEKININFILEKYISIGMPEDSMIAFFKAEGFSPSTRTLNGIKEKIVKEHWILYSKGSSSSLPEYKVVVEIDLIDQKVSGFSGVYLRNMY